MMYELLTAYLPKLDASKYGEWIIDKKNDGTMEHPIQMPYVDYDDVVTHFLKAVYQFNKNHPELELTRYEEILVSNGIKWAGDSMIAADVSKLDGQAVMALIFGVIRADRFCEGALLDFLQNGCIQKWLVRLKELDGHDL